MELSHGQVLEFERRRDIWAAVDSERWRGVVHEVGSGGARGCSSRDRVENSMTRDDESERDERNRIR